MYSALPRARKAVSIKTLLVGAATVSVLIFGGAHSALASCTTSVANINGGQDYTVSGAETGSCTLSSNDTATVTNAGSIDGGGAAGIIATGVNMEVSNDGHVMSSGDNGLYNSDVLTLTNTGTISGINGVFNDGGTITSLTNGGTISASGGGTGAVVTNGGVITALHNTGTITADNGLVGVEATNGGSIGALTNTGLIQATDQSAILVDGTFGLDNSYGIISATTGSAIQLNNGLSGTLVNTDGTITSASTTLGTVNLQGDVGTQAFQGGTISNTSALNSAIALNITGTQSGIITLDGIKAIADGDTAGSGHGVAIAIGANDTLFLFQNSVVIRGDITAGAGALSILTTGSTTITGDITTGAGDDFLAFGLNTTVTGNIDLGGGTNHFEVDGTLVAGGTVTTSSTANTLIGSGARFTVDHTVTLGNGTLTVNHTGTMTLRDADVTTTGAFTNHGTSVLDAGRILSVGSLSTGGAADGTLTFNPELVNGSLATGVLNTGGTAVDLSKQTVTVNRISSGGLTVLTPSLIATGTGAAAMPLATNTPASYLYSFAVEQGTGGQNNNVYLRPIQNVSLADAAASPNNLAASQVLLNDLGSSSDAQIQAIQSSINNAPTRTAYNNIVSSTLPTVDNGGSAAAASFTGQVFTVAENQMTGGAAPSGVSSGDTPQNLRPWVQALGQHANQDERGGVSGYESNTFGAALGIDTHNLDDDDMVGLSFAYGHTYVNSDNSNATSTNVDTYQLTAYGTHAFTDYFVTGMAGFGWDRNGETRHNVGTVAGLDARADYDGWQGAGRIEAGRHFNAGTMIVTPSLSADYVHYHADGYTESGAGGAGLRVGSQDENMLNLGLGAKAEWLLDIGDVKLRPDIHAGYAYDVLNDDKADTTATFAAGGGTFTTGGLNPSNSTVDVGAGVKLYNIAYWDFTATYDLTAKPDYLAHIGIIRATYKF